MSTLYVPADAWDALTDEDRQEAFDSARVPVMFGSPAVLFGSFVDGLFVPVDPDADPGAVRWYAWDDYRITEAHAVALAAALEA